MSGEPSSLSAATGQPSRSTLGSPPPGGLMPSPSSPGSATLGPPVHALPSGVTAVTVTLLTAGDSFAVPPAEVLYRKTVTDNAAIQQLVAMVDQLRVDVGALRGCTDVPYNMQLTFTLPNGSAVLNETTACARATLTAPGMPQILLDSAISEPVEHIVGVTVTTDANGRPSAIPASP
jgi:hypothetical protein